MHTIDNRSYYYVDYDEKAEDAVDYEDIDEEYDGPEVEAATEEDNLLSKKDYFSSSSGYASVNNTASVFDEENYDEDEETPNDNEPPGDNAVQNLSSGDTGSSANFFHVPLFMLAFIPFLAAFWLPCYPCFFSSFYRSNIL